MKKKKNGNKPKVLPEAVMSRVRDRAEALAVPHGLTVHDVTFGRTDLGLTLSVLIRSTQGNALNVTDCELVSRPMSKELDELMGDYPDAYMFEVSSVGIDATEDNKVEEKKFEEVPGQ